MGDLAAALEADAPARPGKIDRILESLDNEDRQALMRALLDRKPGGEFRTASDQLARVLTAHGHPVSASLIRLWRRVNG